MKRKTLTLTVIAVVISASIAAWLATDPRRQQYAEPGSLPKLNAFEFWRLSREEQELLTEFTVRQSTNYGGVPRSMTIGQALENQREFNRLRALLHAR